MIGYPQRAPRRRVCFFYGGKVPETFFTGESLAYLARRPRETNIKRVGRDPCAGLDGLSLRTEVQEVSAQCLTRHSS